VIWERVGPLGLKRTRPHIDKLTSQTRKNREYYIYGDRKWLLYWWALMNFQSIWVYTMRIKSCVLLLLASAGFMNAWQFIVKRNDAGDSFIWHDYETKCEVFSNHAAYQNGSICQCDYKSTFSTENNMCQTYRSHDQGYF